MTRAGEKLYGNWDDPTPPNNRMLMGALIALAALALVIIAVSALL